MKRSIFALMPVVLLLCCAACAKNAADSTDGPPVNPPQQDTTPVAKYDITLLDNCVLFAATPVVNNMARQDYNELSGVAASRINTGVLYVHNDDGGRVSVFLTNSKGEDLGKIVPDNVIGQDVEDISVGPGPDAAKTYIYVADIGDNNAVRQSVSVYRFAEPVITNPTAATEIHVTAVDRLEISYPKGAVNAETLLVDPFTKDLYIATKETMRSTIYKAAYPQSTTGANKVVPVAKTPFDLLTAGDISADGTEILMRNKGQVYYWKRSAGQTVAQAVLTAPQTAPYSGNEQQGEGIGFAADGSGYYTNTEIKDHPGTISTISFYKRK